MSDHRERVEYETSGGPPALSSPPDIQEDPALHTTVDEGCPHGAAHDDPQALSSPLAVPTDPALHNAAAEGCPHGATHDDLQALSSPLDILEDPALHTAVHEGCPHGAAHDGSPALSSPLAVPADPALHYAAAKECPHGATHDDLQALSSPPDILEDPTLHTAVHEGCPHGAAHDGPPALSSPPDVPKVQTLHTAVDEGCPHGAAHDDPQALSSPLAVPEDPALHTAVDEGCPHGAAHDDPQALSSPLAIPEDPALHNAGTEGCPHGAAHYDPQALLSPPDVPEDPALHTAVDEGCPHGSVHDGPPAHELKNRHRVLHECTDATNVRGESSYSSPEHNRTAEQSLEQNSLESGGLIEVAETSNVVLRVDPQVTIVVNAGRLATSDCGLDAIDDETGGLMDGDSQQPQSMQAIGVELSEDNGNEMSPEQKNIEASAAETKADDLVDADPNQKDLTDSDNTLEDSGDFPGISSVMGGVPSDVSSPTAPLQREEDVTAESWRTKRKHVFVLSEAGKPIYSRYGNEEALSSTMGVMMALVSFVQSGNNSIRSIHSDKQKVVFLQQGPLVLVSVSRAPQSEEQLGKELQYVYYQIISMLTQASVARIFERKKNYDLRRLLAGSEKILDSLLDLLDTDPGFLLGAVRCVALPCQLRDSLSSILTKAITPNLVFSILVAEHQLVTVVQERAVIEDCRLDPADLHLLLNLIGASSAFQAGEIWTPICLPRFNPDGYFYAYISYLDSSCTVCLVLLSTDKESFYAVSGCKKKIQEAMEAQNSLQALAGALRCCSYSVSLVGVPELLHFVYKPLDIPDIYRQLPQFTSPEPDGPYSSEEERQRLFDLYRYLHCRIHSSARPLRLIYHVAEKETLLAWVTSKFELYTAFSSLVTKVGAINVITKLLRWIKREEDRLFIRYPPKYSTTPVPGKGVKSGRTDRTDPSQNGFFTGL
ncbi:vacuolar fusion protein MON1 homolog B-like isoform X2 [Eleutherodactylus coqui]|uniref:vacuolar fusion protein MON1 homolog B-like isoform X2 n=1 Tax=Eleutherodactylus coqui TaxID=57060 RepID=UPI00346256E4